MQHLRKYKLLHYALCTITIGYLFCLSLFTHYHVVNNVLVAHAHPFAQQTHSSASEIWLLHQFTSFDNDAVSPPDLFVAYISLIAGFVVEPVVEVLQPGAYTLLPPRAPPVS